MDLENRIVDKLKNIIDPGTNVDVISMGLLKKIDVDETEGKVQVIFRPSSEICPLAFKIAFDIKNCIESIEDVKEVELSVIDYRLADSLNKLLSNS